MVTPYRAAFVSSGSDSHAVWSAISRGSATESAGNAADFAAPAEGETPKLFTETGAASSDSTPHGREGFLWGGGLSRKSARLVIPFWGVNHVLRDRAARSRSGPARLARTKAARGRTC